MKAGDIVFFRSGSLPFKIVRFATGGRYGHVALCVGKIGSHNLLLEATPRGIDINSDIWKKGQVKAIYRIPETSTAKAQALVYKGLEFIGQGYDFKTLLNFVYKKPKNKNDKRQICSELIFRILVDFGYLDVNLANPEMVSPWELVHLLEKYKVAQLVEGGVFVDNKVSWPKIKKWFEAVKNIFKVKNLFKKIF